MPVMNSLISKMIPFRPILQDEKFFPEKTTSLSNYVCGAFWEKNINSWRIKNLPTIFAEKYSRIRSNYVYGDFWRKNIILGELKIFREFLRKKLLRHISIASAQKIYSRIRSKLCLQVFLEKKYNSWRIKNIQRIPARKNYCAIFLSLARKKYIREFVPNYVYGVFGEKNIILGESNFPPTDFPRKIIWIFFSGAPKYRRNGL